jgi:hypothetical protein
VVSRISPGDGGTNSVSVGRSLVSFDVREDGVVGVADNWEVGEDLRGFRFVPFVGAILAKVILREAGRNTGVK